MYLSVCKSREAGKSITWIVENVLKMGGRKFSEGKVKLQTSSINLRKKNENVGRGGELRLARPPRPRPLDRGAAGTKHRWFENRIE